MPPLPSDWPGMPLGAAGAAPAAAAPPMATLPDDWPGVPLGPALSRGNGPGPTVTAPFISPAAAATSETPEAPAAAPASDGLKIRTQTPGKSLGDAVTFDSGDVYYRDGSGALQPTDNTKHLLQQDPKTGKLQVFEKTEGTRPATVGDVAQAGLDIVKTLPVIGSALNLPKAASDFYTRQPGSMAQMADTLTGLAITGSAGAPRGAVGAGPAGIVEHLEEKLPAGQDSEVVTNIKNNLASVQKEIDSKTDQFGNPLSDSDVATRQNVELPFWKAQLEQHSAADAAAALPAPAGPPGGSPPRQPPAVGGAGGAGAPPPDGANGAAMVDALDPQARQKLQESLAADGVTPATLDATNARLGEHGFLGEAGPTTQANMGAIASIPGEAKTTITRELGARVAQAPKRVDQVLTDTLGPKLNMPQLMADLDAQKKEAGPLYDAWRNVAVQPWPGLQVGLGGKASLMSRLEAAGAVKEANRKMAIAGEPATAQFDIEGKGRPLKTDATGVTLPATTGDNIVSAPTAQSFDYMKRALDSKISDSLAKEGGADDARLYGQLKSDLVDAIDQHPDPRVAGVWKAGRQKFADIAGIQDAAKLGKRIFDQNISPDDIPYLTSGYGEGQIKALQGAARAKMGAIMDATRRGDATLRNKFLAESGKEKLRWIYGDEKANRVINSLEHEDLYSKGPQAIIGGSPTQPRIEAAKNWTPQPNEMAEKLHKIVEPKNAALVMGAEVAGHMLGLPGAATTALTAAGGYAMHRAAQAAEKSMENLRKQAAPIMVLRGADRVGAMRRLLETATPEAGGAQPLTRQVMERGRSGRPISTAPLPIGSEGDILSVGAQRADTPRFVQTFHGGRQDFDFNHVRYYTTPDGEPTPFPEGNKPVVETYSTGTPATANKYAGQLSDLQQHLTDPKRLDQATAGARITPLVLDTKDYAIHDAKGANWSEVMHDQIDRARAGGKKGIIIRNVVDNPKSADKAKTRAVYVTFDHQTMSPRFSEKRV